MQDSYFQEEPRPSVELVHYFTYLNSFFLSVAPFSELCVQLPVVLSLVLWEPHDVDLALGLGYRGVSPTTVQVWRPCPLWEPSASQP